MKKFGFTLVLTLIALAVNKQCQVFGVYTSHNCSFSTVPAPQVLCKCPSGECNITSTIAGEFYNGSITCTGQGHRATACLEKESCLDSSILCDTSGDCDIICTGEQHFQVQ